MVKEYEDERETSNFLGREKTGANRSWCAWCERIVLGIKDTEPQDKAGTKEEKNGLALCRSISLDIKAAANSK